MIFGCIAPQPPADTLLATKQNTLLTKGNTKANVQEPSHLTQHSAAAEY